MFIAFLGQWQQHTEYSRAMAEDFKRALRDAGIDRKEAALTMDIPQSSLSEQLAGNEMLSLWRAASLPQEFWAAFAKRRLARAGHFVVVEGNELIALVQAVRALVGRRRMAKAALATDDREEGAA